MIGARCFFAGTSAGKMAKSTVIGPWWKRCARQMGRGSARCVIWGAEQFGAYPLAEDGGGVQRTSNLLKALKTFGQALIASLSQNSIMFRKTYVDTLREEDCDTLTGAYFRVQSAPTLALRRSVNIVSRHTPASLPIRSRLPTTLNPHLA